jgi:MFS family permease
MSKAETSDKSAAQGQSTNDAYAVLHNRDFLFYLIGRFVANIGQQMFVMAVGWELYDRTGSALALGLVGLTQVVPMILLTLPAGHTADNYNRKRVIVLMTLVIMFSCLGLTAVSAWADGARSADHGTMSLWSAPVMLTYLCLIVSGAARTFMWAANAAYLPSLVERKELPRAVNWNASTFQMSSIIGPIIAGVVIRLAGHHAAPVYAANALAALAFCLLISQVRREHTVVTREPMTFKTLLTGFNFVFANKIIIGTITLDMFAVLLGGATSLLPVYAKEILHVGPTGQGLLQAALPLGAVACSFYLTHRSPLQKAGRAMLWAVAAFGLGTIAFGLSKWFWFSFLMLFVCGAVDNVSVVVRHTLVQLLTPDEKRGRVSAVNNLFIGTSNELGEFESGFIAYLFGPAIGLTKVAGTVISVVSGGVGTILVVAAIALIWPEIRKYGRLDGH